ncbi:DNA-binding ferritin-like protein [Orenia metallireducens]|jgi:DNA-binding ferritin-like protein|uniref:DNA-binding ferritin-like protein (Oxidative damage protectant) n=1 Tax=Orenia metallireducens TaxID=1413210 RepID=A0A285HDQ4_9FIRM|nr:ferritin-like domain-containing protein [Orenia metallireducens]PRX27755.1 DNA-binding ferritin-like protein [Orenia metallireducens]SNY33882.1 DNA-binding ferritin-like protein (oxidative damage protectant) [Orenia metallireducens]
METIQVLPSTYNDISEVKTNMNNFNGTFNLNKSGFDPNMPGHSSEHNMVFRQEPRTAKMELAGIGLPQNIRLEMGQMLDDHQCALTIALHQYNKHHWLTEGAESFFSIHHMLEEHIQETQKHIDMVGERVARLGVVPTAHPVTQHQLSYIKHEVEGRYTMRDFLRNDLENELKMQEMMRKTITRAHEIHDYGTAEVLQEVLLKREDFGYHIYSLLEDDTLVRGMNHLLDQQDDIIQRNSINSQNRFQ